MTDFLESFKAPSFEFHFSCRDSEGNFKWEETIHNVVMTAGKNDILNKYFTGSAYTAVWFMLLVGAGTIAASDTLASHPGWTEITAYTGTRPSIAFGAASAGAITAPAVVFNMTGTYTVAGAGCCTVATGSSGVLYDAADFASPRSGGSGDILSVTVTLSVT